MYNYFISASADFSPVGANAAIVIFTVGGPTTVCSQFTITNDQELEGDQDFAVQITGISSMAPFAMIGTLSTTTVVITDDECKDRSPLVPTYIIIGGINFVLISTSFNIY